MLPICSCHCAFSCLGGSSSRLSMTRTHFQSDHLSLLLVLDDCTICQHQHQQLLKSFKQPCLDNPPGHAVSRHLTLIVTSSSPAHPPPPLPLSPLVALAASTTSRLPASKEASALQVLQRLQAHVTVRHERALPVRTNVGWERLEDGGVHARVSWEGGSTGGGGVHVARGEVAARQAPVAQPSFLSLQCAATWDRG